MSVTWNDTYQESAGWHSKKRSRKHKPSRIVSVGFVARATKRKINLVQTFSLTNDNCSGLVSIPWPCVTGVDVLMDAGKKRS